MKLKRVQVDTEGYLHFQGVRISDNDYACGLLSTLSRDNAGRFWVQPEGEPVLVEAFDEPLVARAIDLDHSGLKLTARFAHGFRAALDLSPNPLSPSPLWIDEWNRMHGRIQSGIPFVMNHACQSSFLQAVALQDSLLTIGNNKIGLIQPFTRAPLADDVTQEKFWSQLYKARNTHWDLGKPSPVLEELLEQENMADKKVLVLGSGPGHDAVLAHQKGAHVTAVDISPLAIQESKAGYPDAPIDWRCADAFDLPADCRDFDFILEHTCYCAVDPRKRKDLVKIWHSLLRPSGTLLGVFFLFDDFQGPPFGTTEWELMTRLRPYFDFKIWTREVPSVEDRTGMELAIKASHI